MGAYDAILHNVIGSKSNHNSIDAKSFVHNKCWSQRFSAVVATVSESCVLGHGHRSRLPKQLLFRSSVVASDVFS